jgi:hypothetical protein
MDIVEQEDKMRAKNNLRVERGLVKPRIDVNKVVPLCCTSVVLQLSRSLPLKQCEVRKFQGKTLIAKCLLTVKRQCSTSVGPLTVRNFINE